MFHMSGEGYSTTNPDSLGSGNLHGGVTSVGMMKNAQNINTASFHSVSRANSSLVSSQSISFVCNNAHQFNTFITFSIRTSNFLS